VGAAEAVVEPGRASPRRRGYTSPGADEHDGDALDGGHRVGRRLGAEHGEDEPKVFEDAVRDVGAQREAELDVQHAWLARDAQAQGLVGASLELGDLGVDPTEDLDGAALGHEGARQLLRAAAGDVAQGDVGVSHGTAPVQKACRVETSEVPAQHVLPGVAAPERGVAPPVVGARRGGFVVTMPHPAGYRIRASMSPRVPALLGSLLSITACSAPASPVVQPAPPRPEPSAPVASATPSAVSQVPVSATVSAVPQAPECPATCTAIATPELASALRGAAQRAQPCYTRALRTADISGSLLVKLKIDASGDVCRTEIESSSPELAPLEACVRALFEGKRFPPAAGGCINVNIPMSFTIKEAQDAGTDAMTPGSPVAPKGSP
jgi:TonB family protein